MIRFQLLHLRYGREKKEPPQAVLIQCSATREHGGIIYGQKKRSLTRKNQAPKRNPASNYSPTVKYAVPSSLGPLSIVFGMGT